MTVFLSCPQFWLTAPIAYLLGCSNGSVLVSKYLLHDDVRNHGSGNSWLDLEYGEDGSMIISGIDRLIPRLTYVVGMWSDHTLQIRGEEISLRDLCGRGAAVDFLCEYQHY